MSLLISIFSGAKDNHFVIWVILLDIQDQLGEHILLNYCWYLFKSNSLGSIYLNQLVERNLDIA